MANPFSRINFIKAPTAFDPKKPGDAPMFRRKFRIDAHIESAVLHVCGLGYGYYYLNGAPVSDDLFTAPVSDYRKTLWYNTYDVTDKLNEGENVFAVICGNGWFNEYFKTTWDHNLAHWRDNPKFILSLTVNGKVVLTSDNTWKCSPTSAIIYNQLRSGEHFDARLFDEAWNTLDYDDSEWVPARFDSRAPAGVFRPCTCEPIREDRIYPAKAITKMGEDRYIFDIGQNISGYVRLNVHQGEGDTLTIRYAEGLDENGEMNYYKMFNHYHESQFATDRVICSGKPITWSPRFAYHGFRYVEVTGLKNPTLDTVAGVFVHQMIEKKTAFECSDEFLNALFKAGQMATLSNMFYMPTDCPTREKLGWCNDVQSSAEQFLTNFHSVKFLEKYLQDLCDAQLPAGQMPGIIPSGGWGYDEWNGPVTDGVIFEVPYRLYLHTGDASYLTDTLPYLDRYIEYLKTREDENGDVTFGLSDWTSPDDSSVVGATFINSAYRVKFLRIAELAASLSGAKENVYTPQLEAQTAAHKAKYLRADGTCNIEKQTAVAMTIYHGIYDDLAPLGAQLKRLVEEKDFHHDCGMVGLRHLYMALNKCGLHDYAYRIVTAHRFPSYRNWYEDGMTTLYEVWDKSNASHNHHMFSDFMSWMMKTIIGLELSAPGADCVNVEPHFFEGLDFARGSMELPAGNVSVDWKKETDSVKVTLTVDGTLTANFKGEILGAGVHERIISQNK